MNLTGNTVFITGGGSGIGRALAEELHKRGNKVIIAGRRKDRLSQNLSAKPGIEIIQNHVATRESIQEATASLIARHPKLNVLINGAGVMQIDNVASVIDDELIVS